MDTHREVAGAGSGDNELIKTLDVNDISYIFEVLKSRLAGQPGAYSSFCRLIGDYLMTRTEPEQGLFTDKDQEQRRAQRLAAVELFITDHDDLPSEWRPALLHLFNSVNRQEKTQSNASRADRGKPGQQWACLSRKRQRGEKPPGGNKNPPGKKAKIPTEIEALPLSISPLPRDASQNSQATMDVEAKKSDYGSYPRYEDSSYVIVPESYVPPKCSGRDSLRDEVLNGTYVSFPRRLPAYSIVTNVDDFCAIEDDRFEFDRVMIANIDTIAVLQDVQENLSQMTAEEAARFTLDDTLGGKSQSIYRKAIERIYGERAPSIIRTLKKGPAIFVPLVLKELLAKNKEWKEEKKKLITRLAEQTETCYLSSCAQRSFDFKRNDAIAIRPTTLLREIRFVNRSQRCKERLEEPHLTLRYAKLPVLNDAFDLIMNHLDSLQDIRDRQKKQKKSLPHHLVQEMLHLLHRELPESGGIIKNLDIAENGSVEHIQQEDKSPSLDQPREESTPCSSSSIADSTMQKVKDDYMVFYADSNWYLFFRSFYILAYRLNKVYEEALTLVKDEATCKRQNEEMQAAGVKQRPKCNVPAADRYSCFLGLVRSRLNDSITLETFENELREMFDTHGEIALTLDNVIDSVVSNLQEISRGNKSYNLLQMFLEEQHSGATGLNEMAYERHAKAMCTRYCYRIKTMTYDRRVEITKLDLGNKSN